MVFGIVKILTKSCRLFSQTRKAFRLSVGSHCPANALLCCRTIGFASRNMMFCLLKPMFLPVKTYAFAAQNHMFYRP